jgi:hypothetical protein
MLDLFLTNPDAAMRKFRAVGRDKQSPKASERAE